MKLDEALNAARQGSKVTVESSGVGPWVLIWIPANQDRGGYHTWLNPETNSQSVFYKDTWAQLSKWRIVE